MKLLTSPSSSSCPDDFIFSLKPQSFNDEKVMTAGGGGRLLGGKRQNSEMIKHSKYFQSELKMWAVMFI